MKGRVVLAMALGIAPALAWAQQAVTASPAGQAKPAEAKPTGPQPAMDIPDKIKDFGTVPKGDKIKATFLVKNTGAAPLQINQVRPTCGCTVANFDHTIPAGGTGKIEAEVDTTGFTGPITKAVLVFTNDPTTPQANLVIKADVRAFVEAIPRNLLRFNVLQGEPATDKVILASADGSDFKVTGVDTGGGPYKVTTSEVSEKERVPDRKGSQWEVAVTVPADAPEGVLNQRITVKTTAPKAPEVLLSVSGVVRPIVQVVPPQLDFGTVPADAPVGRNLILINNRQGAELQVSKAEVDNANFTTEVIPLQPGQRFQVAVSLQPGLPKGTQKAVLKITTNDPSRKLIEVPVQATVQ